MKYRKTDGTWADIAGLKGSDGKSAFASAVEGGYSGTEAEFYQQLGNSALKTELEAETTARQDAVNTINGKLAIYDDKFADIDQEIEEVANRVSGAVANTVDNPFVTAYWKDSVTNKLYLVKVVNGVLKVTPVDGEELELEDLMPDRLLLWHDEFDGTTINDDLWIYGGSLWGSYHDDDPVNTCIYVQDSIMHCECHPQDSTDITKGWYCGGIWSKRTLRRGFIQAKIKLLSTKYQNVAFWCNAPDPWPVTGEIDMIETSGDTNFEGALHYGMADGSNGTNKTNTYPSTKDWFVAGLEIKDGTIDLYVNGIYHKTMSVNVSDDQLFGGTNPFGNLATKLIFGIMGYEPATHEDQYAITTGIQCDYVRFYAPENSTSVLGDNITDFTMVMPYESIRPVTFVDPDDGKTKFQTGSKFMMTIETTPHTEDSGYTCKTSATVPGSETQSTVLDINRWKGQDVGYGWYAKKKGSETVEITHTASGMTKTFVFETAQNYSGKVNCSTISLNSANIGDAKYWIHPDTSASISILTTYGRFIASPSTVYKLNVSSGNLKNNYNSTYRRILMEEYDASGTKVASTAFSAVGATITTTSTTASVQLTCNFTDGNNFVQRDYFDMLDMIQYASITVVAEESQTIECTGVSISPNSVSYDGSEEYVTLTATTEPLNTTHPIQWSSQAGFVQLDTSTGASVRVKGITLGADTISVSCGSQTASIPFTVTGVYTPPAVPCTGITLTSTKTVTTNSSFTLAATLAPANTTDSPVWTIDNALATVTGSGASCSVVPANTTSTGTSVVTCTCGSQTATCTITWNITGPSAKKSWSLGQAIPSWITSVVPAESVAAGEGVSMDSATGIHATANNGKYTDKNLSGITLDIDSTESYKIKFKYVTKNVNGDAISFRLMGSTAITVRALYITGAALATCVDGDEHTITVVEVPDGVTFTSYLDDTDISANSRTGSGTSMIMLRDNGLVVTGIEVWDRTELKSTLA